MSNAETKMRSALQKTVPVLERVMNDAATEESLRTLVQRTLEQVQAAIGPADPLDRLRVKSTDSLGNIAWLYRRRNAWVCTLARGMDASFDYAGIKPELIAECRFALNEAQTPGEVLKAVKDRAYRGYQHELIRIPSC